MTLRIIEPFAITETNIDSTNVALETAWTAGTYTLGTVRRVGERLFEVSAASTTQQPGLAGSTEWFDAGPANRYAAFDLQFGADKFRVVETITERADSITYTLEGLPRLSAMAFFGLRAETIEITILLESPLELFENGEQGVFFEPSTATAFTDTSRTAAASPGNGVAGLSDLSGRGNHAAQATAAARPAYQTTPDRITIDKVDDRMIITVPSGGFAGTMVLATNHGTASYGVTIPAGPYDIGGRGGLYFPGSAIVGQLIRNGELIKYEREYVEAYFIGKGATASYGAVTSFADFWRDWTEITSFPLIDTSAGTNFVLAWQNCSGLTSFPLINTASGTNFVGAWLGCSGLTSFPLIDMSSGTNFSFTWRFCSSLTSFPLINTTSGTVFNFAWDGCTSLANIPAGMFNGASGGSFASAFTNTALTQTSIDNILVSLVISGISAGTRVFDQSGGSAPSSTGTNAIDTLRSRGWTVTVTGGY